MKILVLGGTGMIGHRMWASLNLLGHNVYATCRAKNIDQFLSIPGINLEKCFLEVDVLDYLKLESIIQKVKPEIILNCVGVVKQLKESQNAITSIELNSLHPHKLAKISSKNSSRMIQFSTDCVFSGTKGQYKENDLQDADDLYGRSKILGEINDQQHILTMRTSTVGREINPHGGLIEWFLSQSGKTIKGFSQAIYSGMPTHSLAKYIHNYILPNEEIFGVYHIATEPINKFDLLNLVKEALNIDIKILKEDGFVMKRDLNPSKFLQKTNAPLLKWSDLVDDLKIDQAIYDNIGNN